MTISHNHTGLLHKSQHQKQHTNIALRLHDRHATVALVAVTHRNTRDKSTTTRSQRRKRSDWRHRNNSTGPNDRQSVPGRIEMVGTNDVRNPAAAVPVSESGTREKHCTTTVVRSPLLGLSLSLSRDTAVGAGCADVWPHS